MNEQQKVTYDWIADMVKNCEQESNDDESYVHQKKKMHSEGQNSTKKTIEYTEQYEETTLATLPRTGVKIMVFHLKF